MIRHRRAGIVVATLGWAAVAFATLRSAPASGLPHSMSCIVCGPLGGADVLQNVLLFLPLGIGLGMMRLPVPGAVALIFATTVGVEAMQALVLGGRFPSLGDVLANTTGGGLGLWVGWLDERWVLPTPRGQRMLARGLLLAALLVLIAASASLRRVVPGGPLMLEVAPVELHGERFEGLVSAVTIGSQRVSPGRLPVTGDGQIRAVRSSIGIELITGPATNYECSIAAVVDGRNRGVVRVSQDGTDLLLGIHVAGSRLGLRSPRLVLPNVLPKEPGHAVRVGAEMTAGGISLTVEEGGRRTSRTLPLGLASAWIFLYPFPYATDAAVTRVSLAWLALLTMAAGYGAGVIPAQIAATGQRGSGWEGRHLAIMIFPVALFTVAGLGLVPYLLGLAPTPLLYWLAPPAGFALGVITGRAASAPGL